MSTKSNEVFTKENLDQYLRELSKEYKRLGGRNIPVEIILIGGAAIVESYGFREMTTDIDAILPAASIMKEAINRVGDRFHLPNGWLNSDFVKTDSYSDRIRQYSVEYKTFNQVLHVRIVTGEYLIAMKLRAGRKYKNDLSDIVGILAEHAKNSTPIRYDMIDTAVMELYGGWDQFPRDSIEFIHSLLDTGHYEDIYKQVRENEIQAKETLLDFQDAYPGVMTEGNVDSVLSSAEKKHNKTSILAQLAEFKKQNTENPRSPQKQKRRNDTER